MQMELVYHDNDHGAGGLVANVRQCSSRRNADSSESVGAQPDEQAVQQSSGGKSVSNPQPAEGPAAAGPDSRLADNSDPMPAVTMADVYEVAAHARAESTRDKYKTQWQKFHDFCVPQGFPTLPAEENHVALFLVHLLNEGYSVSYIKGHASAITARHVDQELPNPCKGPLVTRVLSGIARIRADVEVHQAPPLLEDILDVIRDTACKPRRRGKGWETRAVAERRGIKDIALASIMREPMVRVCEAARAKWAHLERQGDGSAHLRIPKSKTDQTGVGTMRYLSWEAMQDLDRLSGIEPSGEYIFNLSARSIARHIKATVRFAGFGDGFSSHSCRIGMAVDLSKRKFSLQSVQNAGGWKSPGMVAHYTAGAELADGAIAQYAEERRQGRKQSGRTRRSQSKE